MATEDLFSLVIPSPERALEQNADCTSTSSEQSEASPDAEAQHRVPRSLTRSKRLHSNVSRDSSSASCRRSLHSAFNSPASRQAPLAAQSVPSLTVRDGEDAECDEGAVEVEEAFETLGAM
jgi:hypothetical protein